MSTKRRIAAVVAVFLFPRTLKPGPNPSGSALRRAKCATEQVTGYWYWLLDMKTLRTLI